MFKGLVLLAGATMSASLASAAQATLITTVYDFSATFASGPNSIVSGSVGLTYDPTVTGKPTINSYPLTVLQSYQPLFIKDTANAGSVGTLVGIGRGENVLPFGDLFSLSFYVNAAGDVTRLSSLTYTTNLKKNAYSSFAVQVIREVTAAAPAVPEPATWGLMLTGFGVVGGGLRRQRVTSRFA